MEPSTEIDYDCIVCLDLLKSPVKCIGCKKLLCEKHILVLDNKCPHCRVTPFKVAPEPSLKQELNRRYKQKLIAEYPKEKTLKCHANKCSYESHISNMLIHHKCKHADMDLELMLFGPEDEAATLPMATEKQQRRALYASQQANNPRPGQRMKIPSYRNALFMATHVNRCDHEQCRHVWTGPWGTFVGGIKGDLYFDLTECPIGKRYNLDAGWDYEDFRN